MLLKRRPAAIMRGGKKKQQKTQDMIKPKKNKANDLEFTTLSPEDSTLRKMPGC